MEQASACHFRMAPWVATLENTIFGPLRTTVKPLWKVKYSIFSLFWCIDEPHHHPFPSSSLLPPPPPPPPPGVLRCFRVPCCLQSQLSGRHDGRTRSVRCGRSQTPQGSSSNVRSSPPSNTASGTWSMPLLICACLPQLRQFSLQQMPLYLVQRCTANKPSSSRAPVIAIVTYGFACEPTVLHASDRNSC